MARRPSHIKTSTRPVDVLIRPPVLEDGAAFIRAAKASRSLHEPWVEPPRNAREYDKYLARLEERGDLGFLVCRVEDGGLVGVINMSNIIRGAMMGANLGYYAFEPFARLGLMTQGMRLVVAHAFGEMELHRLEANIQPGNAASIALVRRCGFVCEGTARRLLRIRGEWRDHERWALLNEDAAPPMAKRPGRAARAPS